MPTYLSPGVYVEEVESGARPLEGVGTAVAAFVGLAESGPFNEPTLVSNWTAFTDTFGGFVPGSYLARSVYAFFNQGGGNAYVVRIGPNGSEPKSSRAPKELPSGPQALHGRLKVTALDEGTAPGELSIEISDPGGESPEPEMFKLVVKKDGEVVEEFDQVTFGRGKTNVVTVVKASSKLISVEEVKGAAMARPENAEVDLMEPPPPAAVPSPRLSSDDYVGDVADRTGFGGLETVDEITMLAVPDLMSAYQQGVLDLEGVQAVQLGMIAHCELMGDRIAILDPPPGLNAQQVKEWRIDKAGYDSAFAALYYPWVKTANPATGKIDFMPPSGHIAGHLGAQRRHPWRAQGAGERGRPRSAEPRARPDDEGAGAAQPAGDQLHPRLRRTRHPGLGCPDAVLRPGLAIPEHPTPVQLPRGVDPRRARTGSCSSPTTRRCGHASVARSQRSSSTSGARVRSSEPRRTRRSTSSATTRRTPPKASTPGRSSARSAWRR